MPTPDEYRSRELEAAAKSGVERSSSVLGAFVKFGVPIATLALVGWIVYSSQAKEPRLMTAPDKEEFHTTQYPAPGLAEAPPNLDLGKMTVPPPPPEPEVPPPPVAPPSALAAPPFAEPIVQADDAEARRLAAEEERRRWERLRAPQVVADGSSSGAAAHEPASGPGAVAAEEDGNRRFLATTGSAGVEKSIATKNERIDALVAQGTMIRGELLTAIQSDLPGSVKAITREDVWSFDGRRVLIPTGSTLLGEYRSGLARGQTRIFIVWTRLLRPDGVSVQLGSIGTDDLGRAGVTGFVDNHYVERFGASIALSVIGGVSQFVATLGQQSQLNNNLQQPQSFIDPVTGLPIAITTQPNQNLLNARQIGAQQVSQSLTRLSEEALRESIRIPPTIYVDQGERIVVFIRKDLDFSLLYPDPVKEALRELRRERQAKTR
jgi:type IV secretion system protein VirB10